MNRRLLAAITLSAALAGPAAQALPVYVNIAPPVPRVEVQDRGPGTGLRVDAGLLRLARRRLRLGRGSLGASAAPARGLGRGPLAEHAGARLVLETGTLEDEAEEERRRSVTVRQRYAHQASRPSLTCRVRYFSTSSGVVFP